jgi:large subunit ribosomal protein L21
MFAVISLGGKQYRVTKGERLVVDRLAVDEGGTLAPAVVLASDGAKTLATEAELKPVTVSVRVKEHTLGPKIHVRTYRAKKSSSRRMGFRARQSVIEVESIAFPGAAKAAEKAPTEKAAAKPAAEKKPAAAKKPAEKKPAAAKKPAAKKPAEKTED